MIPGIKLIKLVLMGLLVVMLLRIMPQLVLLEMNLGMLRLSESIEEAASTAA